MRLGVHMRMPAGLERTARDAVAMGCETMQIFAGNPNSWNPGRLDPADAARFRETAVSGGIDPVVLHTAYLLNLASPDPSIYQLSTDALCLAMRRSDLLGAHYVVTHIGSHKGSGVEQGLPRILEASKRAVECSDSAVLLLEGGSGGGNSIGSSFEELGLLMQGLSDLDGRVGLCLDTAHLWGAGYDMSVPEKVLEVLSELTRVVGISWLKVFHLNDTQVLLGSRRDRHARIGEGNISLVSFAALVNDPRFAEVPGILETPWETPEQRSGDLEAVKALREKHQTPREGVP